MASRAIPARRTHFACAVEVKDTSMATGTVKWFNPRKAGFLQPSGGGRDIFVHISAVGKAVLTNWSRPEGLLRRGEDRGRTAAGGKTG
jgi:CspA family cold shock protein